MLPDGALKDDYVISVQVLNSPKDRHQWGFPIHAVFLHAHTPAAYSPALVWWPRTDYVGAGRGDDGIKKFVSFLYRCSMSLTNFLDLDPSMCWVSGEFEP